MLYWCIKNSIVIICFTVLAIVFDTWWIVLGAALFISDYKETPINNSKTKDEKGE